MGLDALVQTDYMSSEHSDAGNVSAVDYAKHRTKMISSGCGLEVRRPEWRSAKVKSIGTSS